MNMVTDWSDTGLGRLNTSQYRANFSPDKDLHRDTWDEDAQLCRNSLFVLSISECPVLLLLVLTNLLPFSTTEMVVSFSICNRVPATIYISVTVYVCTGVWVV